MNKYFLVYYRCKANGNGAFFAVSEVANKRDAKVATYSVFSMQDRSGYYAPVVDVIDEERYAEFKKFKKEFPNVKWD